MDTPGVHALQKTFSLYQEGIIAQGLLAETRKKPQEMRLDVVIVFAETKFN